MKKYLRVLIALVVLTAGSALASAPQFDGGPKPCYPTDPTCIPLA